MGSMIRLRSVAAGLALVVAAAGMTGPSVAATTTPSVTIDIDTLPTKLPPPPVHFNTKRTAVVDGSRRVTVRWPGYLSPTPRSGSIVSGKRSGTGYVALVHSRATAANYYTSLGFVVRIGPRGGVTRLAAENNGYLMAARLFDGGRHFLVMKDMDDYGMVEVLQLRSASTGKVVAQHEFRTDGEGVTDWVVGSDDRVQADIVHGGSTNYSSLDIWHPLQPSYRHVISQVTLQMTDIVADRIGYVSTTDSTCAVVASYAHPGQVIATYCGGEWIGGFSTDGTKMLTYPVGGTSYRDPAPLTSTGAATTRTMTLRTLTGAPLVAYHALAIRAPFGSSLTSPGGLTMRVSTSKHSALVRCSGTTCYRVSPFLEPLT